MYVAVKGGERAIENAHRLLAKARGGDRGVADITRDQISEQLGLAVDRVRSEGSLYDRELAALAIKQARGDLIEAIFLVRAFRATLPRFGAGRVHQLLDHRVANCGELKHLVGEKSLVGKRGLAQFSPALPT